MSSGTEFAMVYLTFNYNGKKIAVECNSMEDLRDVASDAYDHDGVALMDIIEDGKPAEGMTIITDYLYWVSATKDTLAQ